MAKCSVCGKSMEGIFSESPADEDEVSFLNKNGHDFSSTDICSSCANKKIIICIENIKFEFKKIEKMQAITLDPPEVWRAEMKGIVSGHSVVGTGPIVAIASAITDVFGLESGAYQEKIRTGECTAIMCAKKKALEIGATAICGSSLRVSEATSGHGMLMVSFVGTAVFSEQHTELIELYKKYEEHKKNILILNENTANYIKHIAMF